MKLKITLIVGLLMVGSLSQASQDTCSKEIDCSNVISQWDPDKGFVSSQRLGHGGTEMSLLDESVCAVKSFCGAITVDMDGSMSVPEGGIDVPKGIANTNQNRQQLSADCQEVISSQLSNQCYENKVWNSSGSGLYD